MMKDRRNRVAIRGTFARDDARLNRPGDITRILRVLFSFSLQSSSRNPRMLRGGIKIKARGARAG